MGWISTSNFLFLATSRPLTVPRTSRAAGTRYSLFVVVVVYPWDAFWARIIFFFVSGIYKKSEPAAASLIFFFFLPIIIQDEYQHCSRRNRKDSECNQRVSINLERERKKGKNFLSPPPSYYYYYYRVYIYI